MKKLVLTFGLILTNVFASFAQEVDMSLERHNFFYAGQSKQRRMFIVKDGQVSWSYEDKLQRGEISDAVLMSDGHILVAHQYGVAEVTQDQQTVWSYAAPEGTEIHTIQPIGKTHVVFVQNGKPAKAVVMEIPSKKIVHEFELPISEKGSVHGQFRNARLTSRGTLLIANMALGCIHEYNCYGQEVDRWEGFLPWSVQEMPKTGNLLITGRKGKIQEINRQGQTVWEINTTDYGVTQPQKTVRLKNGHHIINNWYNEWNKEPMDTANAPVQAIEVDKDGKLVWQLRAWKNPDLGPSTTIQLLEEPVDRDRMFFGAFNPQAPKLFVGPNEPIGTGVGIHPGRVAWIHSPGVARWDGKTGLWVEDRWNDQAKADAMIPEAVMQLTGEATAKKQDTRTRPSRISARRDDSHQAEHEQCHHSPRHHRTELFALYDISLGALDGERWRCERAGYHPLRAQPCHYRLHL